jgi:hypothetical protein
VERSQHGVGSKSVSTVVVVSDVADVPGVVPPVVGLVVVVVVVGTTP